MSYRQSIIWRPLQATPLARRVRWRVRHPQGPGVFTSRAPVASTQAQ